MQLCSQHRAIVVDLDGDHSGAPCGRASCPSHGWRQRRWRYTGHARSLGIRPVFSEGEAMPNYGVVRVLAYSIFVISLLCCHACGIDHGAIDAFEFTQ